MGIDGYTHSAAAFEVEGDVDGLPVQAIELGDGVTGGGVEAEGKHSDLLLMELRGPQAAA
ncbi:MAG: hypothetical protein K0Q89_2821 [Thermomicrobiales bacterium]|nr:hypothetical protein [Thermomicrobiales bacterium]